MITAVSSHDVRRVPKGCVYADRCVYAPDAAFTRMCLYAVVGAFTPKWVRIRERYRCAYTDGCIYTSVCVYRHRFLLRINAPPTA